MTFFNTKEEVIDIELTPYGKFLLSKGKWKPAYYEFYDDDIDYDSQYGGILEKQEETQQRVSETPRVKVQYTFEGAEKRYKEYRKQKEQSRTVAQKLAESTIEKRKNFSLTSLPLAKSAVGTNYMPAWSVRTLQGQIDSLSSSVTVTGLPNNLSIVNLKNTSYTLKVSTREANENVQLEDNSLVGGQSDLNLIYKTFEDNTHVQVFEDFILLHIKEENTDLLKENFEMIVYEIEEDEEGQEIEKPLYFKKEKEKVVNNILVDSSEEEPETYLGPDYVSHYFNIYVDKEINTDTLGKYLVDSEKRVLEAIDGYVFREQDEQAVGISPVPQIQSITDQQIRNFEDCE